MYDKKYYKKHENGSYLSALKLLEYIKVFYNFKSVIDFGCGMGTWCKAMEELGVPHVLGIDQHAYDPTYMLISSEKYMQYDLREELVLPYRTDIAVSVEVGEHIEKKYSKIFVQNLCLCSDLILFSAAMPFQGGTGHINEQSCSFWTELFQKYEYNAIDCIRPHFWNYEDIEIWYRNNCILYAKKNLYEKIILNIPEENYPLDIIHPAMMKRILNKRGLTND